MCNTRPMRWPKITLFLLLAGTLCGSAAAAELSLSVVVKSDGNWRILQPGDTVRDGERLALSVESGEATYLYVVYADRDGPQLLHPSGKPDHVAAAALRRIPVGSDAWMVMEGGQADHPDREDLLVIASATPLTAVAALARARAALAKEPAPAPTPSGGHSVPQNASGPPPPGLLTNPGYRKLLVPHDSHVPLNKGAAVLRFSFWHRSG